MAPLLIIALLASVIPVSAEPAPRNLRGNTTNATANATSANATTANATNANASSVNATSANASASAIKGNATANATAGALELSRPKKFSNSSTRGLPEARRQEISTSSPLPRGPLPSRRPRDFWNTSTFHLLMAERGTRENLEALNLTKPDDDEEELEDPQDRYWCQWCHRRRGSNGRRRSGHRRRAPPQARRRAPPQDWSRRRAPPQDWSRRRAPPPPPPAAPRRRWDDRRRRSRRRWSPSPPPPPPPPPPPGPPTSYIPIVGPVPQSPTGGCRSHRIPLESKCRGCPPMKDGKLCASTTWYEDTTRGSCGCGGRGHVHGQFWTLTEYTAAMNCASLDNDPAKSWCPANCGQCYKLCTTGGATQGRAPQPGVCRIFKITNRCGDGYDYPKGPNWCSQHMSWQDCRANPHKCKNIGNTNQFGYPAHFDLQDYHRQITSNTSGLDWDNAEVTFEQVSCRQWNGPQDEVCTGCSSR